MMTINGIPVEPKEGTLNTLFTPPRPKRRLTNDWGDAPTEVDTSEPLLPNPHEVQITVGASPDRIETLCASFLSNEQIEVAIFGRTLTMRVKGCTIDHFSDSLHELQIQAVIDRPSITPSRSVQTLSPLLLEGSQAVQDKLLVKAGAEEQVSNLVGQLYIGGSAVVQERRPFALKTLIKTTPEGIWQEYDSLASTLFATKTVVGGAEAEYQSASTTSFTLIDNTIYWELDINFLTL